MTALEAALAAEVSGFVVLVAAVVDAMALLELAMVEVVAAAVLEVVGRADVVEDVVATGVTTAAGLEVVGTTAAAADAC